MNFLSTLLNRSPLLKARPFLATRCESTFASRGPVKILVVGSGGQIGYSVLQQIAIGNAFGEETKVDIHMLDVPASKDVMEGVRMELEDCAYPTLNDVKVFTDPSDAYNNIDYALLLPSMISLKADMKRADMLAQNKDLYSEQGMYFGKKSKPNAKVLVVGNPCNTNCLIMYKNSGKRPVQNFTSLSRLDHNRVISTLARKLKVSNGMVRKVTVWGNHSSTMHPDVRLAEFINEDSPLAKYQKVNLILDDQDWIRKEFTPKIQERAFEVIKARGKSSALSAGNAAVDHLRDWHLGTPDGNWVSMGVYSDGTKYNIPDGIFYSMPCVCYDGKYFVVDDLPIDEYTQDKMNLTSNDLINERNLANI